MTDPTKDSETTTADRQVPVDWEALEDAFENNAPEVHSYLHTVSGDVLRVVDGIADPQMHVRIAADTNYLRIDPVSSREQYRWMERFFPIVEDIELRTKLMQAIDGKGAFRRFKDVLVHYTVDRERWFAFRSERLRTFMEAWLAAHAIVAVPRPAWVDAPSGTALPDSEPLSSTLRDPADSATALPASDEVPRSSSARRFRTPETLRSALHELAEQLGPKDLDMVVAFAEFLKARRAARAFAHHSEHTAERLARADQSRDEG
jgi:hypothetical protein